MALVPRERPRDIIEAMIEVIADQGFLRLGDGFFDRMELLREIEAGPPGLNHPDDRVKVPLSALQPLDDVGMGLVR